MEEQQPSKRERGETGSASTKPPLKRLEASTALDSGASDEGSLYNQTASVFAGPIVDSPSPIPDPHSSFDFVYRPDMPFDIVSRKSTTTPSNDRSVSRASVTRAGSGSSLASLGPAISGAGYVADRLADFMSLENKEYPNSDKNLEINSDLASPNYRLNINGGGWFEPRRMDLTGPPLPEYTRVLLDNVSYAVLALAHALRVEEASRAVAKEGKDETILPTTELLLGHTYKHGPTTVLKGALSKLRTTLDEILEPDASHKPDDTSGDHSKDIKTKISRLRTTFCWAKDHPNWEIYTLAAGETAERLYDTYTPQT